MSNRRTTTQIQSSAKTRLRALLNRLTLAQPLVSVYEKFNNRQSLGARGEREAERYLLRLGYIIVASSYSDKNGELDLIAVDGETIVFVEVKTRRSDFAGEPAEAVDEQKQRRITTTATRFLKWKGLTEYSSRFDVIAVTWPDDHKPPEIVHYQDAFEATGRFQMFS
ncbi:MAG: YraN family protein [Planctomycetota bacterium]